MTGRNTSTVTNQIHSDTTPPIPASTSSVPQSSSTPPPLSRTKLPSSSPSSARLRRLAPSPVKVPPTPPSLLTSHRQLLSYNRDADLQVFQLPELDLTALHSDPFEYDLLPITEDNPVRHSERGGTPVLRSAMSSPSPPASHAHRGDGVCVSGHCGHPGHPRNSPHSGRPAQSGGQSHSRYPSTGLITRPPLRENRADSADSNISLPLIFDITGQLGLSAERERCRQRQRMGIGKNGEESMEMMRSAYPDVPLDSTFDPFAKLDVRWVPRSRERSGTSAKSTRSAKSAMSGGSGGSGGSRTSGYSDPFEYDRMGDSAPTSASSNRSRSSHSRGQVVEVPRDVLVSFRDDVFGSTTGHATPGIQVSQSQSRSRPAPDVPDSMSGDEQEEDTLPLPPTLPAVGTRDDSVAESFYTFGRPTSARRPSTIASTLEDDDGWSYTLSAYGPLDDDEDEDCDDHESFGHSAPRPSHAEINFSPTPQVPRQEEEINTPARTHSSESIPSTSDSTQIFTPDYTLATHARRDIISVDYSPHSPLPSQHHSNGNHAHPQNQGQPPVSTDPRLDVELLPGNTFSGMYISLEDHEVDPTESSLACSPNTPKSPKAQTATLGRSYGKSSYIPASESQSASTSAPATVRVRGKMEKILDLDPNSPESFAEIIKANLKAVDRSTTITLFVDQEGAREVITPLKFMRAHKPQVYREREEKALQQAALWCETPTRPELFQQTGCIEFGQDPKNRSRWTFHYSVLESLPVLRRLNVNSDYKSDYLSRGASLQIRDLGVYAVCGWEDKGRIEWKFEYLVQPRIHPATGEVVPNERIIVPLGFYVSPNFFYASRAHRLHLFNVFKKQLTPNLVAEKVKPPRIGSPPKMPDTPTAPTATATVIPPVGAVSRTLNSIAKVVSGGSSNPTPLPTPPIEKVEDTSEASTPIASNTGTSIIPPEKKGRKRAATLFSIKRPFTSTSPAPTPPPVPIPKSRPHTSSCPSTASPDLVSVSKSKLLANKNITPMKSMSNLAVRPHTSDTSSPSPLGPNKRIHQMKSMSALKVGNRPHTTESTQSSHPFATHLRVIPNQILRDKSNESEVTFVVESNETIAKFQAKGGFNGPRSNSEDSIKKWMGGGNRKGGIGGGLNPAPPKVRLGRGRPSTADPKLGLR